MAEKIPYRSKDLLATGQPRRYTGAQLAEIAFPLGGIGTGSVSLGGWGQLRDWEIRNRPAKGRGLSNAFFSIRVESESEEPRVKVLQGMKAGSLNKGGHTAGHDSGEGLPCFREATFETGFPLAQLTLRDPDFPVEVELTAFSPFIPLDEDNSSLPLAIFHYTLRNRSREELRVAVMGNLTNDIGPAEGRENVKESVIPFQGVLLSNPTLPRDDPEYGTLALACLAPGGGREWVWPSWQDDRLLKWWEAVTAEEPWPPSREGAGHSATIGCERTLEPGEERECVMLLAWHFPNYPHWQQKENGEPVTWQNWYATQFGSAWDVIRYHIENLELLTGRSFQFHRALQNSTLPDVALDAITTQLSILRTNTCLRLTDGTFYGFEGCADGCGCCEGTCTHVWNYAQALPHLFPALQRSVREADWANSMQDDGFVCFRMPLPLGTKAGTGFHPAADGQMGTVMQVYREWQISGDDEWLRKIWPQCVKALEFAWKYWDADKDGVMEGMQHNTYDMEFYGPNTMMGSLYLGALTAAAKLAEHLGETERAAEYRQLAARGAAFSDEKLFNGEYYEQIVNPRAHEPWPDNLRQLALDHGKDDRFTDWPRWQFGTGCLSDQLLGQWYAEMLGLGKLYDPAHIRATLQSIFRYNWKPDLTDHFCSLRVYACNDEAGLIIATWPRGGRPGYPFWFCDEVWCGIEYQVASHLIYEGFVEEGLAIVKGVRDRHTGEQRNPYNEFECGHHYARSLVSYSLLAALSGISYSAPEQHLTVTPRVRPQDLTSFFCAGGAWGHIRHRSSADQAQVNVEPAYGAITIGTLTIATKLTGAVTAEVGGEKVAAEVVAGEGGAEVRFAEAVTVREGQVLVVTVKRGKR